jgi:hypothetical protein
MRLLLALSLFGLTVSCVKETEETPMIHVVPGAAARALWYEMPGAPSELSAPPVQKTVAEEHPVDEQHPVD